MRFVCLALALLVSLAGQVAQACSAYPQPPLPVYPLRIETDAGQVVIQAEVARTEEQRNCGLMGRPRLADGTGMLFDMRPAGPSHFWMKNTPEPLDLLFFDSEGRLVYIARNARPYSEEPLGTNKAVAAVLELAAGEAARLGLGPGTRAHLPWLRR